MAILLTGALGYIGSHTCVSLVEAGYDVFAVDNLYNSKVECLNRIAEITGRRIPFHQLDLLDRPALESLFRENDFEAVIHFAAYKAVGESVRIPLRYYHNNLTGTINLCETMQKHKVKRLVFSSTAAIYENGIESPIPETAPTVPSNPYGRTKLMIEEILRDLHHSDPDWSIALLRYFNPIGAHPSGRIGEDPRGIPNNLFPYITQVAIGKQKQLQIYGNDYPTPDGTGIRDYIHVEDLAAGHLKALRKILSATGIEAYNLGTGKGYSVLEMVRAFEKATGIEIPYMFADRRPGDVAVNWADPSKAQRELDWSATKTIDDMCADAWRWQSNNPDGYA